MSRVWVADTCALIEVRRCVRADDGKHVSAQKEVFAKLGNLVETERLVWPKEVHDELKIGNGKVKDPAQDLPFKFVEKHKELGCKKTDLEIVSELMLPVR